MKKRNNHLWLFKKVIYKVSKKRTPFEIKALLEFDCLIANISNAKSTRV